MDNNRHIILFLDVEYPRFLVVQHPLVNKINGQCVWREFSQDPRETVVEALFREPKEHENCQEHDYATILVTHKLIPLSTTIIHEQIVHHDNTKSET